MMGRHNFLLMLSNIFMLTHQPWKMLCGVLNVTWNKVCVGVLSQCESDRYFNSQCGNQGNPISRGVLTTLVYGGVRMKGKKYGSIKTVFPNVSA